MFLKSEQPVAMTRISRARRALPPRPDNVMAVATRTCPRQCPLGRERRGSDTGCPWVSLKDTAPRERSQAQATDSVAPFLWRDQDRRVHGDRAEWGRRAERREGGTLKQVAFLSGTIKVIKWIVEMAGLLLIC